MTLAIAPIAQADTVRTPLQAPVVIHGTSSGGQSGSCGFVPGTTTQVVIVGQATPLRFRVQGQGQPTLLITGAGQPQCVMADSAPCRIALIENRQRLHEPFRLDHCLHGIPRRKRNRARDEAAEAALGALGLRVLIVWECQTKDRTWLQKVLLSYLR